MTTGGAITTEDHEIPMINRELPVDSDLGTINPADIIPRFMLPDHIKEMFIENPYVLLKHIIDKEFKNLISSKYIDVPTTDAVANHEIRNFMKFYSGVIRGDFTEEQYYETFNVMKSHMLAGLLHYMDHPPSPTTVKPAPIVNFDAHFITEVKAGRSLGLLKKLIYAKFKKQMDDLHRRDSNMRPLTQEYMDIVAAENLKVYEKLGQDIINHKVRLDSYSDRMEHLLDTIFNSLWDCMKIRSWNGDLFYRDTVYA